MLLTTTTCFGPQVAIIRLCTLKWILSTMCKYKYLDVVLQSGQPGDGHLKAETCSCC